MYEMTKQEALHELKKEIYDQQFDRGIRQLSTRLVAAMKVAVKALEQETVSKEVHDSEYFARREAELRLLLSVIKQKQEPCKDAISREAVLSFLSDEHGPEMISLFIKELPSVNPEPKTGKVITDEDGNIQCSECGSSECWGNYCMNCGAKMEGIIRQGGNEI